MKHYHLLFAAFILSVIACTGPAHLAKQEARDSDLIKKDITYLASDALEGRATGSHGGQLAAEYIARRMKAMKLTPMGDAGTYFQDYVVPQNDPHNPHSASTVHGSNVIGFLDHHADRTIVIGAHYDHLGYGGFGSLYTGTEPAIHNGADDNASGVAGLLYLADICKKRDMHDNFLFISFSGEELGLLGSNYFVKHPTIDLSKVNFMLNMDMIGRLKPEKTLAINGTGTSPTFDSVLATIHVDSIQVVKSESGVGPSDHTSFYYENVPVLHFFTGQHEDYHKPSDDVDKINFPGMDLVMQYITTLLDDIDKDPRLVFQQTQDSAQTVRPDFKVTLGVMPDYLFTGEGMRIDGVRPDRPASNAGLQKGDVVVQMGDVKVTDMTTYMKALGIYNPGQTITVAVMRDGKRIEKQVTFD